MEPARTARYDPRNNNFAYDVPSRRALSVAFFTL
jgi:hypothetical protein